MNNWSREPMSRSMPAFLNRWRPRQSEPRRPLYMMVKPPAEPLAAIVALPRTDPERSPLLHHVTMLPFVDLAEWPEQIIPALLNAMQGFEAEAFELRFDRIVEQKAVTLRSSKRQSGVGACQRRLVHHLEARDFRFFGRMPDPHLTINYRGDGRGSDAMAPIGWTVNEILLIESIYGRATHVVHGRWQLQPRLL